MIPYFVDHCFDEDVLRAVTRRSPVMDFVLACDVGLAEAQDPIYWPGWLKRGES